MANRLCFALLLMSVSASPANATTTTTTVYQCSAKDITIKRMKVYSLCGASPGSMDVDFSMESPASFKQFGLPASLETKATVKAVTNKDVWVEVNQPFVKWPRTYSGQTVNQMKVKVIEDDPLFDDILGESDWLYYNNIPTDGSVAAVSGKQSQDSDCTISSSNPSLPNPSFEVELTARCDLAYIAGAVSVPCTSWTLLTLCITLLFSSRA